MQANTNTNAFQHHTAAMGANLAYSLEIIWICASELCFRTDLLVKPSQPTSLHMCGCVAKDSIGICKMRSQPYRHRLQLT